MLHEEQSSPTSATSTAASPKWDQAREQLASALESGDNAATTEALTAMDEASAALTRDDKTWKQVQKLVELRRKLAQSQSRREAWLGQNMTAGPGPRFVCAVFDAIRRRVENPAERLTIMEDVGRLMGYGPGQPAPLRLVAGHALPSEA